MYKISFVGTNAIKEMCPDKNMKEELWQKIKRKEKFCAKCKVGLN